MIPANVKKATQDAIRSQATTDKKWLEVGSVVKSEYANAEAFTAIKDEFLDDVVYPAMGDDAVRIMRAEIPRTNTKEFKGASATQQAEWIAGGKAKVSVRGKGNSYFARIRDVYAFPTVKDESEDDDKSKETTPESTQVKLLKKATELLAALQKDEAPKYKHREAVAAAHLLVKSLTV
jgi:hypothetical protein